MPWIDNREPDALAPDGIAQLAYLSRPPTGRYDEPEHGAPVPQAFKVANGPDKAPLRTHFHTVDQFQYIASGSGKLGAHAVHRGSVHYADRLTPYGPLAPGAEGFAYVTLRPTTDTGISYMPEAREELRQGLEAAHQAAGDRRSVTLDLTGSAGDADDGTWHDVLADADELRVATADIPAGGNLDSGEIAGDGAFLVVVDGSVDDGAEHPSGSLRWCERGERVPLRAGAAGARVARLQFPHRAPAGV